MAMEHQGQNDWVSALACFKRVLELDKTHVPAYYQVGNIFMKQQQMADALHYLEVGMQHAKLKKDTKAVREIQALLDELLY